jgi:dihydroorotate dehydrogenase
LILAAGLVKGEGFATEEAALAAVGEGHNIIPGWRSIPALLGPVEMGSFTPKPRLGNSGQVLWRDTKGRNLFNRVGLRNPGAAAAAAFLADRSDALPDVYGISIASDPDQTDPAQRDEGVAEAVNRFTEAGLRPTWTTVNISCPNVPQGYAHADLPREVAVLCRRVRRELPVETALWIKLGPDVGAGRYGAIALAAVEGGAEAIVATNTAPGQIKATGARVGVGGASLHSRALRVVDELIAARQDSRGGWAIIGCGGVLDGSSYRAYRDRGAAAVQFWSALVFRGPTAPALILSEAARL